MRGTGSVPRALDFVVIGAQKAGTTTMFQHLRRHPDLFLPAAKEAPFFSRDDLYPKGVEWLLQEYFSQAPEGNLLGKVSPQYMCVGGTAARLANAFPDVRLIAILRDPVERAISQHLMATKRGMESRSFAEAALAQLEKNALAAARRSTSQTQTYVAWGEYGRVLREFLAVIPRQQLHITFLNDLARDPWMVVAAIHRFLGVREIPPPSLGEHFHRGAAAQRLPGFQQRLRRLAWARALWHRLPMRYRSPLAFRLDQWNSKPAPGKPPAPPGEIITALRAHYQADGELLRAIAGVDLPWNFSWDLRRDAKSLAPRR